MCFMCAATQTYDPTRHPNEGPEGGSPDYAVIFETGDVAANTGTLGSMLVGDFFVTENSLFCLQSCQCQL